MDTLTVRQQMKLIKDVNKEEQVILTTIDHDNDRDSFTFNRQIRRSQLKNYPVIYVREDDMFEWDVYIDIRSFIYDELRPRFDSQFAFGGKGFPRTRAFNIYNSPSEDMIQVFSARIHREHQEHLDTFCASLELHSGDSFYWFKTTPGPVQSGIMAQRDQEIYDRMMPSSEFNETETDPLKDERAYRIEDLYPFGHVAARITFSVECPRIRFVNGMTHPSISPDGTVDPRVYFKKWQSVPTVKTLLDSISKILKEPDLMYRGDEYATLQWENRNHRQDAVAVTYLPTIADIDSFLQISSNLNRMSIAVLYT